MNAPDATTPGQQPFRGLSVLIVSWNRQETLDRCLAAVQKGLPGAQTVVVDNGSTPALALPDTVLRLRSEANLGFAGGCNLAFPRCTGDKLLLLNNDALLPSAEPVEQLLRFLDNHPACAAAQAKLVLPDGTLDACGEYMTPFGVLYHHGYRQPDSEAAAQARPVFAGKGACLLLRRSAVLDAGGLFREGFFCYYEDVDLCHRLWLAGHEVWFVPTAPVLHDEGSSARRLPSRLVWKHYLSNMLASACDLWGWRAWLTRGPWFLLLVFACALRRGVLPLPRRAPMPFVRRRAEREVLARVTARPPLRYYLTLARR